MLTIAATLRALLALGLLPITALGLAVTTRAGGHLPATIAASLGLSVGGASRHLLRRLAIATGGLTVTTTGCRGTAVRGSIISGWLLAATTAITAGLLTVTTTGLLRLPIARRGAIRAPRLRLVRLLVATGRATITARIVLLRTLVTTSVALLWTFVAHGFLRLAIATGIVLSRLLPVGAAPLLRLAICPSRTVIAAALSGLIRRVRRLTVAAVRGAGLSGTRGRRMRAPIGAIASG